MQFLRNEAIIFVSKNPRHGRNATIDIAKIHVIGSPTEIPAIKSSDKLNMMAKKFHTLGWCRIWFNRFCT